MTTDTEEPEQAAAPLVPLSLRKGTRIRMGYREGVVLSVRGGRSKPYDFMVKWEGEKYPLWLLYSTAERDYQRGHLKTLA